MCELEQLFPLRLFVSLDCLEFWASLVLPLGCSEPYMQAKLSHLAMCICNFVYYICEICLFPDYWNKTHNL